MVPFVLRTLAAIFATMLPATPLIEAAPYAPMRGEVQSIVGTEPIMIAQQIPGDSEWAICRRSCDHVWSYDNQKCRKIPEKQRMRRERCWRRANEELAKCYAQCNQKDG